VTHLLHHLYQNLSGFYRVAHFSQKCNASASHAKNVIVCADEGLVVSGYL
jgi:hypothetical protein